MNCVLVDTISLEYLELRILRMSLYSIQLSCDHTTVTWVRYDHKHSDARSSAAKEAAKT